MAILNSFLWWYCVLSGVIMTVLILLFTTLFFVIARDNRRRRDWDERKTEYFSRYPERRYRGRSVGDEKKILYRANGTPCCFSGCYGCDCFEKALQLEGL